MWLPPTRALALGFGNPILSIYRSSVFFFFFFCICICICICIFWLNAHFHQSSGSSMAMVSFVLLLAIKPLAGAVYIFICLIATYLLILNSSYSSLFSNLGDWRGKESSFINTHCHNQWISLTVEAGGCVKMGVLHMASPTDHSSSESNILGANIITQEWLLGGK